MEKIQLTVLGLSASPAGNNAYALILKEIDGRRRLPIVIGTFEAQSIAIALEKDIRPPRPLTHDLFKNFSDRFSIVVKQVIIHKLVDGVFYASLICESNGKEEIIDARTSDAIALALRFSAPIFTYKNILEKAGIILKINPEEDLEKNDDALIFEEALTDTSEKNIDEQNDYKNLSLAELEDLLQKAVSDENYEIAAKIRDEISKR